MEYSVYFVLLTCCAFSHGFVVPMSFHKQKQLIQPSLDILSQTLEVATTTEASDYQFAGIDPKISGFLKPPMPTPAGLTRLPGQFQNVFDVLQEFIKDPSDQNSTIVIDSRDQVGLNSSRKIDSIDQSGQNTIIIETEDLKNQNSTVITDSQDLNGQNSTAIIGSIERSSMNSTGTIIDLNDEIGQNFTIVIDSLDQDSRKSTVINDSNGQIISTSSVVIESIDKTGQNSIVTIDSTDQNKFNSTTGTSNETLQSLEGINSFVVDDITNSDAHKQNINNTTQSVMHNVTAEEDNVFPKMTLEQWLNMAGELQQVIQNESTIPIDAKNLVMANDTVQINRASLNETNELTSGIYPTKHLAELPLTLSFRTTLGDSTNDLNNSSAEFINGTDGNVSNLSVAQNENFTAIGQITVTTVSPELSDDSLRQLISTEGITNQTQNEIMEEESVVSVLITENNYTRGSEYFAAPHPVRTVDISEGSGIEAVKATPMKPNQNISSTFGDPEINSIEAVPTNATEFIDSSLMETTTASTLSPGIFLPVEAVPGEPLDKSSNSSLATVSPKDTIPLDGMSMITISLPVTNDAIGTNILSIRSTTPLPFHLSSITADVLDEIDLDHLSTHITELTKQNETVLNPINHVPGEMYPNLDEMKAQFIVDAEEIPIESQAEVSQAVLSTLSQNTTTENISPIPVITGTSVIEQLKQSSFTQPDDSTTIATVSEIIVTSQYINLPTRYPSTNTVDASGIIHLSTSTSKSEDIISESGSPIVGNIQLAKLSQNISEGMQLTTLNQLSNVSDSEKIYHLLRSDLVEDPIEPEVVNVNSITHPLENFLIPNNFTSNESKATIVLTTPASQLTVIPLQNFDAQTILYDTTSSPVSESRNILHPFTNSPVSNHGESHNIYINNLSNGTAQSTDSEIALVSSEINIYNKHLDNDLATLDNVQHQTVETAIISDTANYYNTRPTINDNSSLKHYPTLPEQTFTANETHSVTNIPNNYSINNLASEISTLNSNGIQLTNKTLPFFTVEQNSTVFVTSVSNPPNITDTNDLSNVYLERDNVLDTSLFLINRKPFDPKKPLDSISETEMDTFSLNHSIPTNEDDGPLRIPLMIPNSAYIPPSDDNPEIESTFAPVIENNANAILGLESTSIISNNLTVSPEITHGIDVINDSLGPFIKNNTLISLGNPESNTKPIDSINSSIPTLFSGHDANLPSQNTTNSSDSTIPKILYFSADLESDVSLPTVINQNIQVDDSNVFSIHNPSTIGVISVNGPILISDPTVDYNTAFINSERHHDSIRNPVLISDDSYKNFEPPLISTYQLTNQKSEITDNESIGSEIFSHIALSNEPPNTIKESLNLLPKSIIPEIIVDSTHVDTNMSPPIQITPYSYNINNNLLKVPFNPEATIRFTRIDNFIPDDINSNAPLNVASAHEESMLDSLHEINNDSSGIEQLQLPNNNSNTTVITSALSEPKALFNSYRSTVIDTSEPQTIITSSDKTVTLTPEYEINTRPAIVNSTILVDEPNNTEITTNLEMTNVNIGPESTNTTPAAKNYLKTFGDTVVKGFHSTKNIFRPSESSKVNVSDVLQNTMYVNMLDKTGSVLIQPETLPDTLATNDSPPLSYVTDTFTANHDPSNSYVNQNIAQPHTVVNSVIYPPDIFDTERQNLTNETVQFPTDLTASTITNEATLLPINIENTDYTNDFAYQKTTNSNPDTIQENSTQPNFDNTQQSIFIENHNANKTVNLTNLSDTVSLTNIPTETVYGKINPEDTMVAAILKKEQVNIFEHPRAITTPIQISSRNYETTPFPVVMVANNPFHTFDQHVTDFLLNHNIITTTTKPDLSQSDENIAYSQVENIYPNLQSVETPIYIYNDISETLPVNQNLPKNYAGSQPTQKMSLSFEKPLNPIAENNLALFGEEPIILNPNYAEPSTNGPTADVQNSQQVEHFIPASVAPPIENLTPFSPAILAVKPQTILNTNYVGFSENAHKIVPNLPIIQNVNQLPSASISDVESVNNFFPSFVEPASNAPAIGSQNLQMVENMNHLSPDNLEVVEQQTFLNQTYVELPLNTQATVVQNYPVFENLGQNSQITQILNAERLPISPSKNVPNSSKVDDLGDQYILTNSANPASPSTLIPDIITPPLNIPSLIRLNPLVSENLPSTLTTDSATNSRLSKEASNSLALENSSSIPSSISENMYYLDIGKVENLTPVEESSSFETLTPILSPDSAPMLKSHMSNSSIVSSRLSPLLLNNFETSNTENATDSGMIQVGSYNKTNNLNGTEIPVDVFNVFSG